MKSKWSIYYMLKSDYADSKMRVIKLWENYLDKIRANPDWKTSYDGKCRLEDIRDEELFAKKIREEIDMYRKYYIYHNETDRKEKK